MTVSSLVNGLLRSEQFISVLQNSLAIRYALFSDGRNDQSHEHLKVEILGGWKISSNWSLFSYETTLWLDSVTPNSTDLILYSQDPIEILEYKLGEWEAKVSALPWFKGWFTPKAFNGLLVSEYTSAREADEMNPNFSLYHGIVLEHIRAHAESLEIIAGRERSLNDKNTAAKFLHRRFRGFVSKVRKTQIANTYGSYLSTT